MSLAPPSDPAADSSAEVALLRRRLERERRARLTAEQVCEQSTAQLYDTVQELRRTEDLLRDHLQDQQLVHRLSLDMRRDLDPQGIVRRAVSSVGEAVRADRCLVRFADGSGIGLIAEQWSSDDTVTVDPSLRLPVALERLCLAAAASRSSLVVDDVLDDPRLTEREADEIAQALDFRSYLGTPMWMGERLVGWLVLHATGAPRPWDSRQLAVVEGVADGLGIALMQADAHTRQAEALEQLRAVDRVKSDFVSTVSHELRTPLTSINGYVQLLLDAHAGPLTTEQQRMLGVVERNGHRLLDLVEDLLSLTRLDTGGTESAPVAVDLSTIAGGVHEAMLPLAGRRSIDLRLELPTAVPPVRGSADQLERVVFNLLSNALKFTPEGGTVAVALSCVEDGVRLEVSDTGIGISEADLPHVFDRFFRAENAQRRAIQGTGLGLAVVRSTVEMHGGTVAIASETDRGTTVTITLPALGASGRA